MLRKKEHRFLGLQQRKTENGIAFVRVLEYIIIIIDKGEYLMEFISAREAADKWGISQRRVAVLCSENRIVDATMIGNMWIIPTNAKKPTDARKTRYIKDDTTGVKPFLKWAGGKGQLLKEIGHYYPFDGSITKYAEPFVGGGAVLFDILSKYSLKEIYISDTNRELINTYITIKDNVEALVDLLKKYQSEYLPMEANDRKVFYLNKRERFNILKASDTDKENVERAALMIFLNKTCFNGLFRVNRKGMFNVPMGSYKNPLICDEDNLYSVSEKLKNVRIVCGDYKKAAEFIDNKTFVYFDPPYRPITETASFTAYTENLFNDNKQIELAEFAKLASQKGARVVISNSDPKNSNSEDNFFDDIYCDFKIKRVEAVRMINCNSDARGKIKELLISNF